MKNVLSELAIWACLVDCAIGSFLQREDPKEMVKEFKAKEFMGKWREKDWSTAKKSCDTDQLPKATDVFIRNTCGTGAERERCTCIVAKAHSCHVGCTNAKFAVCPEECLEKKCFQGSPSNGGAQLSGGGSAGKCQKYCSKWMGAGRYCGEGAAYQSGLFLDCKGCDPSFVKKKLSNSEKKEEWTMCMADCYPTPTCAEMCKAGTNECYAQCVETYRNVVTPFWELFDHSSTNVIDYGMPPPPKKVEEEKVDDEELEALIKKEPPVKKVVHEGEDEYEDEYEDEEEWEDEEEGEWKPMWDEDEDSDNMMYDFRLRKRKQAHPIMTRATLEMLKQKSLRDGEE